jgi:hypothetical protein
LFNPDTEYELVGREAPHNPVGGLTVSRRNSYEVAPAACQLKSGVTLTATLPSATLGEVGALGEEPPVVVAPTTVMDIH